MDPELAKALNELAITVMTVVIIPSIIYFAKLAKAYGDAKVSQIKNRCLRESLEFALTRLDATAQTVVTELNQTRIEMTADGKLTPEEAKKLLQTAYTRLKQRLPADAAATLQEAFSDRLQAVIVGKIESKVAAAKVAT